VGTGGDNIPNILYHFKQIIEKDGIVVDEAHANNFVESLIERARETAYALPKYVNCASNVTFLNNIQDTFNLTYKQPSFTVNTPEEAHPTTIEKPRPLLKPKLVPSAVVAAVKCVVELAKQSQIYEAEKGDGMMAQIKKSRADKRMNTKMEKLGRLADETAAARKK
jgi:hypothetical protein